MATLRSLAALLALAFGWTIIVSGTAAALWIFALPLLELAMPNLRRFSAPALHGTLLFGIAVALLHYLVFLITPTTRHLRQLCHPYKPVRLPDEHPLSLMAAQIAQRMQVAPPRVWLVDTPSTNAYALSGLRRGVILLTTPLVATFPVDELRWVLAHEMTHLKHGDTRSGVFWITAVHTLRWGYRLRASLVRAFSGALHAMPFRWVLEVLILLPALVLLYGLTWIERSARGVFRLADRFIGRRMEYRADREAAWLLGPEAGERALQRLGGEVEPNWGNLFATHPPIPRRIRKLRQHRRRA